MDCLTHDVAFRGPPFNATSLPLSNAEGRDYKRWVAALRTVSGSGHKFLLPALCIGNVPRAHYDSGDIGRPEGHGSLGTSNILPCEDRAAAGRASPPAAFTNY